LRIISPCLNKILAFTSRDASIRLFLECRSRCSQERDIDRPFDMAQPLLDFVRKFEEVDLPPAGGQAMMLIPWCRSSKAFKIYNRL
jgi:hypothetical protein